MDARQESKLNMYRTVQMHCDDNASIINTNPAFVTAYKTYVTTISNIINTATSVSQVISGIAIDKKVARKKLCQTATDMAALIFAYASVTKNNSLKDAVDYSFTDFLRIKDDLLAPTALNIYNAANNNLSNLEPYGVTVALLASLQTSIDEYSTSVPKPRTAQSEKITYTDIMKQLVHEADSILHDQLDKLVVNFKATEPNFVSTYKNARIIIDAATSTTQIKGTIKNAANNSPIAFAIVEITGSVTLKTQTNMEGNFTFKPLTPGIYKINITAEGFTSPATNITEVKLGHTSKTEVILKAA